MVDEYQDTNYVQEQLLLRLARPQLQPLRRRRRGPEPLPLPRRHGPQHPRVPDALRRLRPAIKLTTNYRSHERIVERYDRWMAWPTGRTPRAPPFRFDKTIEPEPGATYPGLPGRLHDLGHERARRGRALRRPRRVPQGAAGSSRTTARSRCCSTASARTTAGRTSTRWTRKGIPAFCPRARAYFENEEVRLMVAAASPLVLGWHGDGRGEIVRAGAGRARRLRGRRHRRAWPKCRGRHPLAGAPAGSRRRDRRRFGEGESARPSARRLLLPAARPGAVRRAASTNENRARNLAIFSQLLNVFQSYYHYTVVTHRNREFLRFHFFNSFLRLLHDGGINEYEDPDQPFPKGHVQVMTIHQAKGWSSRWSWSGRSTYAALDRQSRSTATSARSTTGRPSSPRAGSPLFDRMRLHYVAFSRPQKVLVLTATSARRTTSPRSGKGCRSGRTSRRSCWRPSASSCESGCPSRRPTASPATSRSTRPARGSTSSSASTTSRRRGRR